MNNYDVKEELGKRFEAFQQLPYLFVGTGFSMRYSSAPRWDVLLFNLWKEIYSEKTERDFEKLKQKIERDVEEKYSNLDSDDMKNYVNPMLATALEEDFNHRYYMDDGFDEKVFSEPENNEIISKHHNPFKYLVSKQTKELKIDASLKNYKELMTLMKYQNKFAGVITTNYDCILEEVFKDFSVLIGQENLLLAKSWNVFEIFKIHGSCNAPDSIVLTEKDYSNFDEKLKYLSAKLLTIFVEHPIVFIGYSLSDVNIRKILCEIACCLNADQLERIKENFILISRAHGKGERYAQNNLTWGKHTIVVNQFFLEDYNVVYETLAKIRNSIPIKLAKKLQDMVCQYVYSADAMNDIIFGDLNSPEIDDEKVAVYFGKKDIIAKIGFSHFTLEDILEDILFDNKPFLMDVQLIEKTFRNIRSMAGSTFLPIYKYVKGLDYQLSSLPSNYHVISSYEDVGPTTSDRKNHLNKSQDVFSKMSEIEKAFPNHIPRQVAYILKFASVIETEDLGDYVKKYFRTEKYEKHASLFRKLIALYDYKKYYGTITK